MNWAYSIQQKTKAILLLAFIGGMLLIKTFFEKHNVSELNESFSSVFEDRLLVESYIYELSDHLYRKRIMLENCSDFQANDMGKRLNAHSAAIRQIISDYEKTKFTKLETTFFGGFKENVVSIGHLEAALLLQQNSGKESADTKAMIDKEFESAFHNLHSLSAIQITEGKHLTDHSRKIVAGTSLLVYLEMAIVIAIFVMIQMLLVASKTVMPKIIGRPSLN